MSYTITRESFDSLAAYWNESSYGLNWNSPFVLPTWMKVWWQELGPEAEPYLGAVREGDKIIGIAPLLLKESEVAIIGGTDVCDYLDFIVTPGRETDFFTALLDSLLQQGINRLDLKPLRPDSTVLTSLAGLAEERGYEVIREEEGVSVELDLPATFDEYLTALNKKQRHEVRRKLRRLEEVDKVDYLCHEVSPPGADFLDDFLKLFAMSREEKADFMTARMESFFRALTESMAEIGLLRFGVLKLDNQPAAMTMCFDYNDCVYLYNSGYDSRYNSLSVGLLSKVLGIKESIRQGKKKFDLLKGDEVYKYRLGGKEVPLYRCRITIR